jgi:hypothetical protein
VRVLYNGVPLTLSSDGSELLRLEHFRALLARHIPQDFHADCGSDSASVGSVQWPVPEVLPELTPQLAQQLQLRGGLPHPASALALARKSAQ